MRKILFIGIVYLLGIRDISAQTANSFGFQASMNFSYRTLENNNNDDALTDDIISYINNREKASIGYRIAAVGNLRLGRHWIFETGVSYTQNAYTFRTNDLNYGDFLDPRDQIIYETGDGVIDEYELVSRYRYLGIPSRFIWSVGVKSTRFLAHFGVSPQFLVEEDFLRTITYADGTKEETEVTNYEDIETFNLTPFIGLGLEFSLDELWALRMEGVARYGALNINEDSPINTHLYSTEFNAGIYYRFGIKMNSED